MRTTKIAFLIDSFLGTGGGAEKHLFELVLRLPNDKYLKEIYTFRGGTEQKALFSDKGFRLHVVPLVRAYSPFGMRQIWRFAAMLRQKNTDILQTCHFTSDLVGAMIKEISGIKCLVSNRRDMGFLKKNLHKKAYRWISPKCNKVIAVSGAVGKYLRESESCRESQIEVIYNGVDLPEDIQINRERFRKEIGVTPEKILIGSVANLKPEKRPEYTLEAVAHAIRKVPEAMFVFIGETCGTPISYLEHLAGVLGIGDRVIFAGMRNNAGRIVGALDIFVLGSKSEGMSNALLEAMAAGLPAVVTNVGGNPETIRNGIDGYLVPSDNVKEYAERIRELLLDQSLRCTMGESARKRVRDEFTFDRMASEFQRVYNGINR